ncbi:hypothetical protein HRbin25_00771 [bacterium HR25]|jgi:hypothetical protein|nr:hypothetical protein HRbin25_00771 [bacterium HR25]
MQQPPPPLSLVIARIVIVSGVGFCAALGVFLLIGGIWHLGLGFLAATLLFIFLMFFIERLAER